jgi:hypothetical protein
MILHHYLKIKTIKDAIILFVILTIGHTIEEYLGNTTRISIEGTFVDCLVPLIDPLVKPEKRKIDNDYLENSIGDVLSGAISNLAIITYWYNYKKLPYFYFYGIIPVFFFVMGEKKKIVLIKTFYNTLI